LTTVEGALDARHERVERFGMLGVASPLVSAEPLQRVLEVPLAEIDLALGPESAKGGPLAVVELADDPEPAFRAASEGRPPSSAPRRL